MRTVLIAAGGTGGHIYPALAVAEELKTQHPDLRVEFIGTPKGLENRLIPESGYPLNLIPIGRLNSNVSKRERITTLLQLPWAVLKCFLLILKRRPVMALGFGGFVSGPVMLASALLRVPTGIWEPNAMPGMANRLSSRFVEAVWLVFDVARANIKARRFREAGMPVRKDIEALYSQRLVELDSQPEALNREFHLLIFGGSQGARGINEAVCQMLLDFPGDFNGVHIVHQTGKLDFERIRERYDGGLSAELRERVQVLSYLNDMAQRYAWADLIVCRSGTGTLSEIAACGKAAILIPFPAAADDHQRKNAETLQAQGAARMIVQSELTPERLRGEIRRLLDDRRQRRAIEIKALKFHRPKAAADLARDVWKCLVERSWN